MIYKRLFKSSAACIGLDIEPDALKLIQLKKTNTQFVIEKTATLNLPDGAMVDGKIKQWEVVEERLKTVVEKLNLKGMKVAISIPQHLVRMDHIQLPEGMSNKMMETEIASRIERDFPGMYDTLCMDFNVYKKNENGYVDIFFVVTRQDYLSQYGQCLQSAGLQLKIIDIDIYAYKRLADALIKTCDDEDALHIILFFFNHQALLLLTNANTILLHQQLNIRNAETEWPELKNRISLFLSNGLSQQIKKVILIGRKQSTASFLFSDITTWGCELIEIAPWQGFKLSPGAESNVENTADYMLACGLAMREVPKW